MRVCFLSISSVSNFPSFFLFPNPCSSVRIRGSISLVGDAASDNGRHGSSAKFAAVEWRVVRFTGGFRRTKCPFVLDGKNRKVAGLIFRDLAMLAEDARRPRCKQFHHARQRKFPRMHELKPECDRRLKTSHAKWGAIKFYVFERG